MYRSAAFATLLGAAIAAQAVTPASGYDTKRTALQINQSGFICSDVISITPGRSDTLLNVDCIEFHDGTGRVSFAVDTASGLVMQHD